MIRNSRRIFDCCSSVVIVNMVVELDTVVVDMVCIEDTVCLD